MKGYISYADLKNGSLNLYDLQVLNDLINYENKLIQEEERKIQRKRALSKRI
jgi:hypothetical protein